MNEASRQEIADLLIKLAEKRDWDHDLWKRCHELVQANLDDELLCSFYQDLLGYPGLFNLHLTAFNPTRVSIVQVRSHPAQMDEMRNKFTRVATALRAANKSH